MLTISIDSVGEAPRSVRIERVPCVLGRGSNADVQLSGWRVAKEHALIERDAAGLRIVDRGSLSGTEVNGERIVVFGPLSESDEIVIGGHRIRVLPSPRPSQVSASVVGQTVPGRSLVDPGGPVSTELEPAHDSDRFVWRRLLHRRLLSQIDLRRQDLRMLSDDQLRQQVGATLQQVLDDESGLPSDIDKALLLREVLDEAVGLGPLEALLVDETVSEIMVNGTAPIHVERAGRIERTSLTFSSDEAIRSVIDRIVAPLGRHVDEASPMVDARLADGSRLNAVIPPLSLSGPAVTIRRFNRRLYSAADLVDQGSLSGAMLEFLRLCVTRRFSVVVSGGTGSGKTTLLNLLSGFIDEHERVITIEDAAELRLAHRNLVSLEARPANAEGRGLISVRDLVRNALRMRPDRIVVGECRGGEALDMLQAMNTGHDGSLTTVHANSPRDALSRIEVMALMSGVDLPLQAIREQIASAIQVVIQLARLPDGSRRVAEIAEVTGIESGRVLLQTLFRLDGRDGELKQHRATGHIPQFLERLGIAEGASALAMFGAVA